MSNKKHIFFDRAKYQGVVDLGDWRGWKFCKWWPGVYAGGCEVGKFHLATFL